MYNCDISAEELEQIVEGIKMLKAINNNNLKAFNEIFYSKYFTKENLVPPTKNHKSLLIYACERSNTNIVKCILKSNKCSKKLLMHTTDAGENVLHYICKNNNFEILKLIVQSRLCDKKIINQHDKINNETPLTILIKNNYVECAKYIINSKKCVFDLDILFHAYLTNTTIFEHIINSVALNSELKYDFIKRVFVCKYGTNAESFVALLNSKFLTEDVLIDNEALHVRLFGAFGNDGLALKFIESDKFTYDILKKPNVCGCTCLHFAFTYRSIDIVLKILDNPFVDSSIILQPDGDDDNLLEYLYIIDAPKRPISEITQILGHPKIKPHVLDLLLPNIYYICDQFPDMFLYLINFEDVTKERLINAHSDGWTYLMCCTTHCSDKLIDLLNIDMFDKDYFATQTQPDEESEFSTFGNLIEVMKKGGQTFLHILAYKNPELFLQIMTHEKVQHILHVKDNSGNTCYNFLLASNNNGYGKCKICFESDDFVSLNCGHVCCKSCADTLEWCHLCRKNVTNFNKVYL